MSRYFCRTFFFAVLAVLGLINTATANLIANGNFETLGSGGADVFANWAEGGSGALAESVVVIGGDYSAEIVRGSNSYLQQAPAVNLADFWFEMDFAVFPRTSNRTLNVLLYYGPSQYSEMINLRVGENNRLQAYNGSSFQPIGALTAGTTDDSGSDLSWTDETPVTNHLKLVGHFGDSTPSYDITLANGQTTDTVTGITYFQGAAPGGSATAVNLIRLQTSSSDSNWLADNVVFIVPEPGISAMLGALLPGLLLAGRCRRKRRA